MFGLHLLLLTANQWLTIRSLRPVTTEALAIGVAGLMSIALQWRARGCNARRAFAVLLASCVPLALHSLGVSAALLGGWELEGAGDRIATARHLANAAAALMFALLLRRVCGLTTVRALIGAALFAALMTAGLM